MAFVALAVVPIVAAVGASVDAARIYTIKARLVQAVDAAALAGGRAMLAPTRDDEVRMLFSATFPSGFLGATPSAPSIAISGDATQITVSASANMPMTFFRLLGVSATTVHATGTATRDVALDLVRISALQPVSGRP